MNKIKVAVHLTVEVDPEAWDMTYGTGTDQRAVREDVRSYVLGYVQGSAAAEEGAITNVKENS